MIETAAPIVATEVKTPSVTKKKTSSVAKTKKVEKVEVEVKGKVGRPPAYNGFDRAFFATLIEFFGLKRTREIIASKKGPDVVLAKKAWMLAKKQNVKLLKDAIADYPRSAYETNKPFIYEDVSMLLLCRVGQEYGIEMNRGRKNPANEKIKLERWEKLTA